MDFVNGILSFSKSCIPLHKRTEYKCVPFYTPTSKHRGIIIASQKVKIVKSVKCALQHESMRILPVFLSCPVFIASLGLLCISRYVQSVPSNIFTTHSTKSAHGGHEVGKFYSVCVLAGLMAHICYAFYSTLMCK